MPQTARPVTIRGRIRTAVPRLESAGVATPLLDAEILLAHALSVPKTFLIAHPEEPISREAIACFEEAIRRRCEREPLAYIVGEREFYGRAFEVSPAVLIPRPETEILVEAAVSELGEAVAPEIADIGVGSGALAVSIAASVPSAVVFGTDCSEDALEIARRNAEKHGVGDRVSLHLGSLYEPLAGKTFDLVVSNPPYIPSAEIDSLQPEIAKHEPRVALDGGADGLCFYRAIVSEAPRYLKPDGLLAVEVGVGQAAEVRAVFGQADFRGIGSVLDYAGIERVLLGGKPRD